MVEKPCILTVASALCGLSVGSRNTTQMLTVLSEWVLVRMWGRESLTDTIYLLAVALIIVCRSLLCNPTKNLTVLHVYK